MSAAAVMDAALLLCLPGVLVVMGAWAAAIAMVKRLYHMVKPKLPYGKTKTTMVITSYHT